MGKVIKLNYITIPAWWDTDVTLLPFLISSNIEIILIIIIPHDNSIFSELKIKQYCDLHKIRYFIINRKKKIRHINNLLIAVKIFNILKQNNSSNQVWNFFEYILDPYLYFMFLLFGKKRTIISFHNYKEHSGQIDGSIDKVLKLLYIHWFNYFHLHSKEQSQLFQDEFPNKQSVFTIMPPKDFGLPQKDYIIKVIGKTNFLFFGYIKEYKNLKLLITAFENLNRSDAILTIAGNCNDFSDYEKMIVKNDHYNLNIRFIENDEIPTFFSNADFLVLPYKDATQSGPLLIAMNYNLPIIANNVEPFNNLIENKVDGLLFDATDQESLKTILNFACELENDQYQIMKQNQKIKVDSYLKSSSLNGYKIYDFISTLNRRS